MFSDAVATLSVNQEQLKRLEDIHSKAGGAVMSDGCAH